jgi:integrase
VTAPATPAAPAARPGAALSALLAAVRPEFRADELVFPPGDPVFGGDPCRVAGCDRTARGRGLCQGHLQRWVEEGRPDLDSFVIETDPRWARQRPNACCRVDGCGYGVARDRMCQLHAQRWARSGHPDLDGWLADPPTVKQPAPGAVCAIAHCTLWPQAALPFCHSHASTWKVNGQPDLDLFAARFSSAAVLADERIELRGLGRQLKLEVQYALQCRHDERTSKTPPAVVMQVVRFLAGTDAASLLERSEQDWRTAIGRPAPKDSNPRALLAYARRKLEDLLEPGGWDAEFARPVWRLHRLGFPGRRRLRFDAIPQPWLAELAKRWLRWRLSTGLGLEAAARPLRVITGFARFLDRIGIADIAQIDRGVLERYLADLHAQITAAQQRGSHIGLLNAFLAAIRQHHWDEHLPAGAMFFAEDYPKRPERLPRALAEHVVSQLEDEANLDRWDNDTYRLVTVILMRCGLRVSDALQLATDCVVSDADSAPYLRYVNHKMKRDALVPIDEQVRGMLDEQRARNDARWPAGTPVLFPRPTKNVDGLRPIASTTYRLALYRWLERCEIRDENGRPAHLTPHQWRHTLGTTLINRDVPQEVVRRILDHDSHVMVAHYARLHDTTVRRHWEKARKVNASGQTVTLDPDGPLAEAAWAKHRLARVTQALPNGYCGLPVHNSCPHANSCLTCPMFLTTPEFLPQHREQRRQTVQIISAAQARGQQRVTEMNQQLLTNLDAIISALTDGDTISGNGGVADAG